MILKHIKYQMDDIVEICDANKCPTDRNENKQIH